jgi:hypothetical protein
MSIPPYLLFILYEDVDIEGIYSATIIIPLRGKYIFLFPECSYQIVFMSPSLNQVKTPY